MFEVQKLLQFHAEPEILYLIQFDSISYDLSSLPFSTLLATVITSTQMMVTIQHVPEFFTRHIAHNVNIFFLVGNLPLKLNTGFVEQLCRKNEFPFIRSIPFADKQVIILSYEHSELQ